MLFIVRRNVTANQTQSRKNMIQCFKGKYPEGAEGIPTKKEDKKKLRHSEWVEQIAKCQSNGMKIKKRLHYKFQECNHYQTHTTKRKPTNKRQSRNETATLQRNGEPKWLHCIICRAICQKIPEK